MKFVNSTFEWFQKKEKMSKFDGAECLVQNLLKSSAKVWSLKILSDNKLLIKQKKRQ